MPKLVVLGNCVAERLCLLLKGLMDARERCLPFLSEAWDVIHVAPVHGMSPEELGHLARLAFECDCVFSQPLFRFGSCNTENLREKLGSRLHLFSAPNFGAYFPDAMDIRPYPEPVKFAPPLEWHSKVIVQCREAGMDTEEIGNIYPYHRLFKSDQVKAAIDRSLEIYARRDADVEIGSLDFVKNNYMREPLFYTWNHPGDALFRHLLEGMLETLGVDRSQARQAMEYVPWAGNFSEGWSSWGFGFNAWPIITRRHDLFRFPGREWFKIEGERVSISTAALGWYRFYNEHPAIYEKALAMAGNY